MLINTELFRTEANHFKKYGYYTPSVPGTIEYREYWEEQKKRCRDGYSVGGMYITGEHYGYLNFAQIKLTADASGPEKVVKDLRSLSASKIVTFPDFWDGDYEYFHVKNIARWGIEPDNLAKLNLDTQIKPDALGGGKHLCVGKARRKGYSYKNGYIAANRYNVEPDSITLLCAHESKFLFPEGTMKMASDYLEFLNEHTAWTKRRLIDKKDHKKAGYISKLDGIPIQKGYKSQIISLSFKDNADAARGKDGTLILFEEAGKWPNILDSYASTQPTVEDGRYVTGQIIVFGTGGGDNTNWEGFESMFYEPETYNMLPFENIWDENASGTFCSFFVPDYQNKIGFIDKDGNSDKERAIEFETAKREEIKRTANNPDALTKHIMERCFTPREAFFRSGGNIFPTIELNQWLGELESKKRLRALGMLGDLYWDDKGMVKWQMNSDKKPIVNFPLKKEDSREGATTIWEHPYRDGNGNTPYGLYIAGCDPIDQDEDGAPNSASLGSVIIYKTFQGFDKTYSMPVAEYTGRPESAEGFYEEVRKLLTYFNAQCLYENNLKGLKIYFEQKKNLHLLKEQPSILKDIVPNSTTRRGYGIHMSEPIKRQCEIYVRDWLLTKRGDGDGESGVYNMHTIYSIPLIKELIAYSRDGNFDRVIAFMLCILHSHENYNIELDRTAKHKSKLSDPFFRRQHFRKRR